ncbi:MAG: hypothetical protein WAS90_07930 [Brachymonas denitrificans]
MAKLYQKKDGSGYYVKGALHGKFCTWQVVHGYGVQLPDEISPTLLHKLINQGVLYTHGSGLENEIETPAIQSTPINKVYTLSTDRPSFTWPNEYSRNWRSDNTSRSRNNLANAVGIIIWLIIALVIFGIFAPRKSKTNESTDKHETQSQNAYTKPAIIAANPQTSSSNVVTQTPSASASASASASTSETPVFEPDPPALPPSTQGETELASTSVGDEKKTSKTNVEDEQANPPGSETKIEEQGKDRAPLTSDNDDVYGGN